jgi:uncharacterized protein
VDRAGTQQRPNRRWLLWIAGAVVLALVLLSGLVGIYVDVLWFREVGFSNVFWTVLWSRVLLAVVFGLLFFAILYANLLIARSIRPRYQVFSPGEEAVDRYRMAVEPYTKWLLPAVAILFALFAAGGVAGQWDTFQQWRASGEVSFGVADPVFARDVGFYVLSLPFQRFIQAWLFSSFIVITVVTAGAHYLWGGIRVRAVGERVTPQVKAHLSVLLGLIVLVKAWGYRIGQFDLLVSPRGTVTGASYTDVHAHLPGLRLLVLAAILVAILFIVNIRFRGWALPVAGVGILAVASVAVAIYTAVVQRIQVDPQEFQREREYIARNIEFTRRAFNLDTVEIQSYPAEAELTAEEVEANSDIIELVRMWNPDVLGRVYRQLQRIRPYYDFPDVDVDRYEIDGQRRLVMLSPRAITQEGIRGGGQTWQNRHLVYTHGYGVAASQADNLLRAGAPSYIAQDIPPRGELAERLEQPRIYFQENTDVPYLAVRTGTEELDFPTGGEQFARYAYTGEGGIEVGGILRRASLAWHFRDVNLLISGLIQSDTNLLINIDLPTRVQKIAPFLRYDFDPYAAIVDGRIVWIWDAYTESDAYPYSERLDLATVTGGNQTGRTNYMRNSVKVVVDAYDGTTTLYLVDETDAIAQAWSRIFPDLLTPLEQAPMSLREHFRYPEDLFRIQAEVFTNYHVTDDQQFYAKEDFWAIPRVPADPTRPAGELQPLAPYYVLIPLPGEEDNGERFVLFTPFTPAERPNMVAWMAAVSDPDEFGRMVSFEFPLERNVPGPQNVSAFIAQDGNIAQQISLWDQLGSRVIHGDLLAIPIGQSFLYVQPLYLESAQAEAAIPELRRVIVVHGDNVEWAVNIEQALALAFDLEDVPQPEEPEEPPEPGEPEEPGEPGEPGEPVPGEIAALLAEAEAHFLAAQQALQNGDLATYQREIDLARQAVEDAAALAGGG